MARAIAILCFCPPETFDPLSPTKVLSPSGNNFLSFKNLLTNDNSQISSNLFYVYSFTPYVTLYSIVPSHSIGS